MTTIKLSERLLAVASHITQGAIVADIGSDHAYLPTYLVQKGIIQKAVAGEVVVGPYETARNSVFRHGVSDKITVRLADGLFAIEENDGIDTVTIAGMGGSLIATILEQGKKRLQHVKRLIVQPNLHAKAIREWAVSNNWELVNEQILKEDGKIYEILVLEKGVISYDDLELLVGPFLLAEKNSIFREKWENEISQWTQVLSSLEKAVETPELVNKKEQLSGNIESLGKVLEK
ncbi:tRNA (adenine-N(1))-methyltransferase [Sporosarcina sp. Marseille-Q4063]|uniref:tRNA (adenine(22)-N(1))-methyltransferase n=1 Tax=Sporosarcina sp. Marseille-Q4063 TaxID=2810514 RepID=UPI001BAF130D|nr:tRNA (adenine(22)-N(1))-methyltransferase TrmK [Sporosarcina sp. Marseille-Q4063]QUW22231.1 tRNA (adenine-N(1))-methyltransferase [Sporosarcina sp. Marseille-Q4063]